MLEWKVILQYLETFKKLCAAAINSNALDNVYEQV